MRAIIMAGGEGRRLRPLTCNLPKPMMPIMGKPVIEHCVRLLCSHGITDITATLHYLPNAIKDYLGNGSAFGANISYSIEETPLGTAGSVRQAMGDDEDTALIISGDALTDFDLTAAIHAHKKSGVAATIVLTKVGVPTEYGVALLDAEHRITRFLEKPQLSEVFSDKANTGIYILEPEVLALIPKQGKYDFSQDLFPRLLQQDMPIYGYEAEGYWCDIGNISEYIQAHLDVLDGKVIGLEDTSVDETARISPHAALIPPYYIGKDAEIAAGSIIGPYAVVGDKARVGRDCSIKRSIVMNDARLREESELRGCVVAAGAHVQSRARIFDGAVIGEKAQVGKGATVEPGVLVWPQRQLEEGKTYVENVKWDERQGIQSKHGYSDFDMTPIKAVNMGAAFASLYEPPASIAVATDGSQQGLMLKYALCSGVVSQGIEVMDFFSASVSEFEYGIRQYSLDGGAYIKRCAAHEAEILLYAKDGMPLSSPMQRKFDQALLAGDFRPVTSRRLGLVEQASGASKAYEAHILRAAQPTTCTEDFGLVLSAPEEMFNNIAKVLLAKGYRVVCSEDAAFFNDYMRAGVSVGCKIGEGGKIELLMYRDQEINPSALLMVLLLDLYAKDRTKFLVPTDFPDAYVQHLSEKGATVMRAPIERAKWYRAAIEEGCAYPELFESETAVVRLVSAAYEGRLDGYLDELPGVQTSDGEAGCSWRDVGRVMRSLVENRYGSETELIDGVRVREDKGWVLVRPTESSNAIRVVANATTQEYARELCDIYLEKLHDIIRERNS